MNFRFRKSKEFPPRNLPSCWKRNLRLARLCAGTIFGSVIRRRVRPKRLLLKMDGEKISSTAIKNYLANGETEKANALLGEEFFLLGQVYKDRQVGRTINFPTANIRYPEDKFPIKKGVYETRVCVDGKEYKGITNYGARPTFDNTDTLTETYLDGFDGDLYNKTLQVRFVRYLRGIRKFESAESLKAQLTEDIRRVREHD